MEKLKMFIIKFISYFYKQNKKLLIFVDDFTPRFYKICKSLDEINYDYEIFVIKESFDSNIVDYNFKKFNYIESTFKSFLKLLKYKGSTAHFILNENLEYAHNIFKLKIFKNLIDIYDHKFLYKESKSIIKQKYIENKVLKNADGIISRSLGLRYKKINRSYDVKKILFLDYCLEEDIQKILIKKNYYNLIIIFPRWNSIYLYKNLKNILKILIDQDFKVHLILEKENIKNLDEIIKKNSFKNIYSFEFSKYESYKKILNSMDCYLWISVNQLINVNSKDYVYKLAMHDFAASNRIYEMIERNIFSATPSVTRFDSFILNRYSNCFIYDTINDLRYFRKELEKTTEKKPKNIKNIFIRNNIKRLIKFYNI